MPDLLRDAACLQICRTWLPLSCCGSDYDDGDTSDSDEESSIISGEIRISVHILPEITEQIELPAEDDIVCKDASNSAWSVGVEQRCVAIECCQYEVARGFECVCQTTTPLQYVALLPSSTVDVSRTDVGCAFMLCEFT